MKYETPHVVNAGRASDLIQALQGVGLDGQPINNKTRANLDVD